jgi:hypothetical protein
MVDHEEFGVLADELGVELDVAKYGCRRQPADASGWNGEDLCRLDEPYVVVSSAAAEDDIANEIADELRRDAGVQQAAG